MTATIFKVCSDEAWAEALTTGAFTGSPDDDRDGFIHLSTAEQLHGTLEKHFRDVDDLVLIAFATAPLGDALKWEPSRNNELFPHYYGALPVSAALSVAPLPLNEDGIPDAPSVADLNAMAGGGDD
ncbi:MAG: DUF952 domain-containing protein [Pseudomonadota bacterium]